jgi:hypothetical protein
MRAIPIDAIVKTATEVDYDGETNNDLDACTGFSDDGTSTDYR